MTAEMLAGRPIPTDSYYVLPAVVVNLYLVSLFVNWIPWKGELVEEWHSTWPNPSRWLSWEHPARKVGTELIGNLVLVLALMVILAQAEVADLWDAARIGAGLWLIVVVILVAYAVGDRMPWLLVGAYAGSWLIKLIIGAVVVAGCMLYPETWIYEMG